MVAAGFNHEGREVEIGGMVWLVGAMESIGSPILSRRRNWTGDFIDSRSSPPPPSVHRTFVVEAALGGFCSYLRGLGSRPELGLVGG